MRFLLKRFGEAGPAELTKLPHAFFGPLTTEEWQALQWRHLGHHLRQFGAWGILRQLTPRQCIPRQRPPRQ